MGLARTVARTVGSYVARNVGDVIGGGAWSPASLNTLLQRYLDTTPTYSPSTVASLPILTPEEPGTLAVPRSGRCWEFDGINDYGECDHPLYGHTGDFSMMAYIRLSSLATFPMIFACKEGNYGQFRLYADTGTLEFSADNGITTGYVTADAGDALSVGITYHVAMTYTASSKTVRLYIDGLLVKIGTLTGTGPVEFTATMQIGCRTDGSFPFDGLMRDLRIYTTAKSAAQILAISNQHLTPSVLDAADAVFGDWCEEESGTTGYNWADSGNNVTLINITQAVFHNVDGGVPYSAANELGHTVDGSVIVPRDESDPTKDAAGNALGVAGPVKLPAVVEVPCVTLNGTSTYGTLGAPVFTGLTTFSLCGWVNLSASGSYPMIMSGDSIALEFRFNAADRLLELVSGNPAWAVTVDAGDAIATGGWHHVAATFSAGLVKLYIYGVLKKSDTVSATAPDTGNFQIGARGTNLYFPGSLADLRVFSAAKSAAEILAIKNGTTDTTGLLAHWPIQDGPGADNTNRTIHDVSGNGKHLTLVGGTVSTIWGTRTGGQVQDHCVNYGGRLNANNVFIPGLLSGSNAADGNAKNLTAGKHGNPYSRVVPNYWSAPSLTLIGHTSSVKLAPTDAVQSVSPADTKFRRTKSDGDNRYFATRTALTGTDKVKAEAYVS